MLTAAERTQMLEEAIELLTQARQHVRDAAGEEGFVTAYILPVFDDLIGDPKNNPYNHSVTDIIEWLNAPRDPYEEDGDDE